MVPAVPDGVSIRPMGDGLDRRCLFPAIKSIPTENAELLPLLVEADPRGAAVEVRLRACEAGQRVGVDYVGKP